MFKNGFIIFKELRSHIPFTFLGTLTGIGIMLVILAADVPRSALKSIFWVMHPAHVILSAWVTTAMYRLRDGAVLWRILCVGYAGSVGIATLSDCAIPFVGEWILNMPNRGLHLGFIEKWWLVNPLALAGIGLGVLSPHTKLSHASHVLVSTWASLFHITMAMDVGTPGFATILVIAIFLFLAVWVPCCTSDIVFPLLFARGRVK